MGAEEAVVAEAAVAADLEGSLKVAGSVRFFAIDRKCFVCGW